MQTTSCSLNRCMANVTCPYASILLAQRRELKHHIPVGKATDEGDGILKNTATIPLNLRTSVFGQMVHTAAIMSLYRAFV